MLLGFCPFTRIKAFFIDMEACTYEMIKDIYGGRGNG